MKRIVDRLRKAIATRLEALSGGVSPAQRWPLVALVVLYVLWRTAGGELPLFMFRSMLLLVVCSYIWTRLMLKSVDCIFEADRREMTRGDSVKLTLRFENEGFVPVPNMMARSTVPGKRGDWSVITAVPALKSRVLTLTESLNEHGHYRLGPVEIAVSDPFGWFRGRREIFGNRFVTVYPRIFPVTGQDIPLRRPFGTLRTRIRSFADPSNLADIRPMVPGDNPRHIHWPTTARMGEHYVREFELTASGEVNIVLDLNGDPEVYPDPEARETAFDLTAGVAAACLRSDLAVGLTARDGRGDHSLRAAKGSRHLRTFMKSLAHARADSEVPLEIILRRAGYAVGSGSTLLAVTGRMTPGITSLLTSLIQSGLGVGLFLVTSNESVSGSPSRAGGFGGPGHRTLPFPVWTLNSDVPVLDLDSAASNSVPRTPSGAGVMPYASSGGDAVDG